MSYRNNLFWLVAIIATAALLSLRGPSPSASDALSGTWMTNDKGQIALQQKGDTVVWTCKSSYDNGKTFTHVFRGQLQGKTLSGYFADQAPGANRNSGNLVFELDRPGHLKLTKSDGCFGGYSIDKISEKITDQLDEPVNYSHDLIPAREKHRRE